MINLKSILLNPEQIFHLIQYSAVLVSKQYKNDYHVLPFFLCTGVEICVHCTHISTSQVKFPWETCDLYLEKQNS